MQDDAIGWDPTTIYPEPSTALKIYTLFCLIAIVAATTRLVALWISAPPLRLFKQANNATYLRQLSAANHSFKQWIGCALLAGGFVACTDFHQACNHLLRAKAFNSAVVVLVMRDSINGLSLGIAVALLLFLARWHVLTRIAHLYKLKNAGRGDFLTTV